MMTEDVKENRKENRKEKMNKILDAVGPISLELLTLYLALYCIYKTGWIRGITKAINIQLEAKGE